MIEAGDYSDFRRTAPALIYPPSIHPPCMAGKLTRQYYNLLLPRIINFFIDLEFHFSSKNYWKGVVKI